MLGAIALLFEANYLVNCYGLSKVIRGKEDEETSSLVYLRCFGYAPSLSSKTISRRLLSLKKKGFVEIRPYKEMEDAIFLTIKGEMAAMKNLRPSLSLQNRKRIGLIQYEGEK